MEYIFNINDDISMENLERLEPEIRKILNMTHVYPIWYIQWYINEWMVKKWPFIKSFIFNEHISYAEKYDILEIGCEWGRCTERLAEIFINSSIVGIDGDSSKIEFAEQFTANNSGITYIHDTWGINSKLLPYRNYDFIFCTLEINQIEKQYQLDWILQCLKMLKNPDSKLFITPIKNSSINSQTSHWDDEHWRVMEYTLRRWIKYVHYIDHSKLLDNDPVQYTTMNSKYDYYQICLTKEYCNI